MGSQGPYRDLGSGLGAELSLKNFRKNMILEFYNEAGQLAIAYKLFQLLGIRVRPCRNWMPPPMLSPSSTSSWSTRDGNATSKSLSPRNLPCRDLQSCRRSPRLISSTSGNRDGRVAVRSALCCCSAGHFRTHRQKISRRCLWASVTINYCSSDSDSSVPRWKPSSVARAVASRSR